MAHVSLTHVRKVYPNGFEAVKDFSLQIADGEFVVLVGPSGCGKTTTLRMVAGLEDISSGTIDIGGRVVNDVHPKDRDIAMVFQNYALYPHMTVYKNMAFALKLRGVPRAEIDRRVNDAARILGIEALLDRKPKALSGGQRQRVAVGRAIVREPKAFLFDEPLSNLDAKLRVTTRAELKALHLRLKTTTIYVTHDQEEAMTLGDRIVVMSNGLIQQSGPPLEVYQNPVNRFVAAFVGMPPMNFLAGSLRREGDSLAFVEGSSDPSGRPYTLPVPAGRAASLAPWAGKEIVLGLRPQMFSDDLAGASATMALPVRVTEPLGDTIDVFGSTPKHPHLVARVPARAKVSVGQNVTFAVDMHQAHFFEPGEFGRNIMA
ncbi:MAG: sn-glycerol-3-phosphate ABC transporter ATP-binding protein UgpC [Phycisphaeraceae bacterium]|nr:MAG: sn-glycerol-3-phosphate ABC transporter ATP-binding protein UgpC [Phycisphaeraceae bacterium]